MSWGSEVSRYPLDHLCRWDLHSMRNSFNYINAYDLKSPLLQKGIVQPKKMWIDMMTYGHKTDPHKRLAVEKMNI